MKSFIEIKSNSIHPIYTSEGWVYLLLPMSVMEYFHFFQKSAITEEGKYMGTTLYMN